jgi:apolipoprotein N-acyltransferase
VSDGVRRLSLAAAFALLLALAFPFRVGHFGFDAGVVVGWLALAPLARLCTELRPAAAFRWAFFASWAGYAGTLFWLYVVVRVHGGASPAAGVAAVLVVTAVFAAHAGAAAALASWLAPRLGLAGVLVLPAAWIVAEHLRGFDFLGGFPWSYLGYSLHLDGPILALASLAGVYGLGFLAALAGSLLGTGRGLAALGLVVFAHGAGMMQERALAADLAPPDAKPLRVAMVQGNIPQGEKWDPELAKRNVQVHLDLSREAIAEKPDLILWPEAAVPGSVEYQREFHEPIVTLVDELGVPLVIGGIGLTPVSDERRFLFHNSVFVVVPGQGFVDRYDKSVLVPFGEYVPLRQVFGFLSAVATTLADMGDLTPGSGPRPLAGLPGLAPHQVPVALICYEAVYPDLVRQAVAKGANLLLNLTNDAWYGRSSGPDQFLAIASLRSAEHGLPMLRAANTGVTALVDARGQVVSRTALFERRVLTVDVPPRERTPTFYTRWGDWPIAAAWAFLVASGGFVLVRRRER